MNRELHTETTSEMMEVIDRVHRHLEVLLRQAEGTPLAAELGLLAAEIDQLCNHAVHLDDKFESAAAMLGSDPSPTLSAEEQKAIEIQREIHEFNPSTKDALKALFMWRDSPKERIWREEQGKSRG